MKIINYIAFGVIMSSSPSYSNTTEEYVLSLPVGKDGSYSAEVCANIVERQGGRCQVLDIIGNSEIEESPHQIFIKNGELEDIMATGDFVPWPWSRNEIGLTENNFPDDTAVPVIVSPCFFTTCSSGSTCQWSADKPLAPAQCITIGASSDASPLLSSYFNVGSIIKLEIDNNSAPNDGINEDEVDTIGGNEAILEPHDDSVCGTMPRGWTCMETHIVDDEGQIRDIP